MKTMPMNTTNPKNILWLAVALAAIASLAYLMMAWGLLAAGDLQAAEKPLAIIYVAASCYLVGGLLILARRRWLWMIGALVNAVVILFFFQMYQGRMDVVLSPGGLVSKAAQISLEVALLYLIVKGWKKPDLSKINFSRG